MKKLICILILVCTLSLCSCGKEVPEHILQNSAGADVTKTNINEGTLTFALYSDGTASVTSCSGEEASVTVPDEIDGAPVTEIASGAFYNLKNQIGRAHV